MNPEETRLHEFLADFLKDDKYRYSKDVFGVSENEEYFDIIELKWQNCYSLLLKVFQILPNALQSDLETLTKLLSNLETLPKYMNSSLDHNEIEKFVDVLLKIILSFNKSIKLKPEGTTTYF